MVYTPQSFTWNLKKMVSTRNLLFQGAIFRFRVNLQGCIPFIYDGFLAPSNRWSLLFGISEPSTVAQLGRKKNTWFLPLQLGPLPNPFAKRGDFPSMGLSGDASSQVSIVHEWCVNLKKKLSLEFDHQKLCNIMRYLCQLGPPGDQKRNRMLTGG